MIQEGQTITFDRFREKWLGVHDRTKMLLEIFQEHNDQVKALIMVEGKLQREGDVIHVVAIRLHNFSKLLRQLGPSSNVVPTLAHGDEGGVPLAVNKRAQVRKEVPEISFPEARNFK